MGIGELTVKVEIQRRPLGNLFLHAPRLWWLHYRDMRRREGVVISAYVAWVMASYWIVFPKKSA